MTEFLKDFAKQMQYLKKDANLLVLTHKKPDGDAHCSAIAIKLALNKLGYKNVDINIPNCLEDFDFLPEFEKVNCGLKQKYELVTIVDTPEFNRVDTKVDITKTFKVVIDHHNTEDFNFGELKYVDSSATATCEILFDFFQQLKIKITKDIAICLYCGILSDTDLLTTRINSKKTFEILSKLVSKVNHTELVEKLSRVSIKQFNQKCDIIKNVKIYQEKDCVISFISEELLTKEEKQGKINSKLLMQDLQKLDLEIKVLLIPTVDGIKISFRSSKKDLLFLSEAFGGGGHKTACGANLILKDGFYVTKKGNKICAGTKQELIKKIIKFI